MPSNFGPNSYEVYAVVEGAQNNPSTYHFTTEQAGEAAAELARELLAGNSDDWQVFVLPHFCQPDDGGCECSQWLSDHHPTFQSPGSIRA